jgi:DNA-binding MurR/RpiR family transcriptional regulator
MGGDLSFDQRLSAGLERLSPAEQQVARFFQENREAVLVDSASALAARIGTSDATVVRTAKALGYAGLDALRQQLAAELRLNLSPATRMARTLGQLGDKADSALGTTLDVHIDALQRLREDIKPDLFQAAIDHLIAAKRVFIFGIGPSSAMADYFAIQLGRFGMEGGSLTKTGLLFADDLLRLKRGDLAIVLAYGRVYREVETLLDHANRRGIASILLTDTLGPVLRKRVNLVLPVARGRADKLSMHTATLGLIEALLVGIAAKRSTETLASLKSLNDLRAKLVGEDMELPLADRDNARRATAKRPPRRR